jgi:phage repressor protein C with HTH and peptisase S24 domain
MARTGIHGRLERVIAHLGLRTSSFERALGFSNGSIGKVLDERRSIGSDRLETIFSKYPQISPEWLLTGRGEMVRVDPVPMVREEMESYGRNIPITEISAAAGPGYMNTEVLRTSEFVQLPGALTKTGKYLCVRIKGSSMAPTLQDAGYVVIRQLERHEWKDLLNERVYVVSDREGKTYLKRLRNRLDKGCLVLSSDNPDKASHPNFNLQEDEIVSIWYVEWYLSAKMPNIHDQFYSKLERIEEQVEDLSRRFDQMERRKE